MKNIIGNLINKKNLLISVFAVTIVFATPELLRTTSSTMMTQQKKESTMTMARVDDQIKDDPETKNEEKDIPLKIEEAVEDKEKPDTNTPEVVADIKTPPNNKLVKNENKTREGQATKEEAKPVISTKEEIKSEVIEYNTVRQNDANIEKGKEIVTREGQKGTRQLTFRIVYSNGVETERTIISDKVIKSPVDRIISVGTKEQAPPANKTTSMDLPNNYSYDYQASVEDYMIFLVNEHRVNNGLNPLVKRADLSKSARYKSLAMLQLNYFSHSNPNLGDNNSSYLIRTAFGYKHYTGTGENLTIEGSSDKSQQAAIRAFNRFVNSPGHNKNMLNASWKHIGVGVVTSNSPGSRFGSIPTIITTQHFGN